MTTQTVNATLRGFGTPPTAAMLVIERLTPGRRLGRAAAVFGLGLAAAAIALPIPIVHFVLVPGSFLAGLILAGVRLSQREIVLSAEGACPFCGTRQRLGLAGRKYRLPRRVHCSSCGQELDLDPIG
ncbi:MAG TPA: hypothetical protein VL915_06380 [Gemmatimonadales bacterium]|jgi:hypothetical protein|nr:hypothetical protein [Gemmatimonadales bacterium]HVK01083.1 hypothetical protein [Gemmatimonadales bacterium]